MDQTIALPLTLVLGGTFGIVVFALVTFTAITLTSALDEWRTEKQSRATRDKASS
jgi:hypothetical protein